MANFNLCTFNIRIVLYVLFFVLLFIQQSPAKKINIGFDKFPILLDLADYQLNHTVLDKYYWCKFKLTIYF